jgi:GNAT superfamily N-acetyltransferase
MQTWYSATETDAIARSSSSKTSRPIVPRSKATRTLLHQWYYSLMSQWGGKIRRAEAVDVDRVAGLAEALAASFPFDRGRFRANYPVLLANEDVCLLVAAADGAVETDDAGTARADCGAADGAGHGRLLGYLLGFRHLTFFANGLVGWVEEVLVHSDARGLGVGAALMGAFEDWAAASGAPMVALSTRRAAPFYLALGYEESAVYFRKMLPAGR